MRELKVNRAGINMAEDALSHEKIIIYNEKDSFTKLIKKELVKKNYFVSIGKIVWEIYTLRDLEDSKDGVRRSLKLGYVINIKGKWFVGTTCLSSKMADIINFCEYNKSSLSEIHFTCNWLCDIV